MMHCIYPSPAAYLSANNPVPITLVLSIHGTTQKSIMRISGSRNNFMMLIAYRKCIFYNIIYSIS